MLAGEGKALLMVEASQPEVTFFFFLTQHVVKRSLSPRGASAFFCCCHGECAHYIIMCARETGERGLEDRVSLCREATRLCGRRGPRATADPHTAHKGRHTCSLSLPQHGSSTDTHFFSYMQTRIICNCLPSSSAARLCVLVAAAREPF